MATPKKKQATKSATPRKKSGPTQTKKAGALPVEQVVEGLAETYPDVECALEHDSAFQLLIATILSAQCTDERVNIVTNELFAKYPTAATLAKAPLPVVEKIVQSTGFFRAKAKNIVECSKQLVARHGGEVPPEMESLVVLPGVGRKTANVVLGTAFGIPTGVVVDTHVGRISKRLGFTKQTDAVKIERDLMALLPESEWIMFAHRLIHHGRRVCQARKPKCESCTLASWCAKVGVETKG
jgi:endonuclease III